MIKVSDTLYRGSRPDKEMLDAIKAAGIKTLIDLESGVYEALHNDLYKQEDQIKRDYGLVEFDYPCSDIFPPKKSVVDDLIHVTKTQSMSPAYVHCLHGVDRTGYVVAAYRMQVQGWSFKDAVSEMFACGFHKAFYFWWVPFLMKYEVKK